MSNKKFSQFVVGNENKVGDLSVGLRGGVNTKFDFPGIGIKDASGNFLYQYGTAGASAVNYLMFINSISGSAVEIVSDGSDSDVAITINPKGTGAVHIPAHVDQVTQLDVGNLDFLLNTISSTNTNGNINLSPNGTGHIILSNLSWPITDGAAGQVITTDGAATLSWATVTTFSGGSSTDNAIARYDGTAGAIQNSGVIISDANAVTGMTLLDVDNLELNGNTISTTNSNGSLLITPNGTGDLTLDGLKWPQADGTTGQVLKTDGSAQLSWTTVTSFSGGSSTDNAIARYDGSGGVIQNSGVIISDANGVSGITQLDVDNIRIDGNTISSTDTNGIINMSLNGAGTWTINSTVGVVGIINDNTMATAAADNLPTALSIKTYVDAIASGFSVQGDCVAASTTALTVSYSNGAAGVGATLTNAGTQVVFSVDGISATVGQRVLIKNQASALQNGIYQVTNVGSVSTNWILTRPTNYDSPSEITPGDLVIVTSGTTQAQSSWLETATVAAVGTDPITFVQFSASIPVSLANGGTGANLTASNGGIFYSSASAGAILAGTATANQMLQSGSSSAPAWSTSTWPATTTAKQLLYSSSTNTVAGLATAVGGVLVTDSSSVPSFLANPSSTGNILQSVSGNASAWSTATYPSTAGTSGTLLSSNGTNIVNTVATYPGTATGTGTILRANGTNWVATTSTFADTYAVSTLLYASSANTITGLATANNAILTTNSSGVPAWVAGTFATTWSNISGTTQAAAVNSGYVVGNASQTTITLPATAALGSIVAVQGKGAAGWILAANTGQVIHMGASATSTAGSLTSSNLWDSVEVVCVTADTTWAVRFALSSGLTVA